MLGSEDGTELGALETLGDEDGESDGVSDGDSLGALDTVGESDGVAVSPRTSGRITPLMM